MGEWERLASELGIRLPPPGEAPTPTVMRQFLNRIHRSVAWYYEFTGEKSLREFAQHNPTWPARARAGTVLEAHMRDVRQSTTFPAP